MPKRKRNKKPVIKKAISTKNIKLDEQKILDDLTDEIFQVIRKKILGMLTVLDLEIAHNIIYTSLVNVSGVYILTQAINPLEKADSFHESLKQLLIRNGCEKQSQEKYEGLDIKVM